MLFAVFITIGAVTKAAMLPGSTALWFEYWPGDLKVPGRCPVPSVAVAAVPLSMQGTLLSLLQSTQLYING